MWNRPSLTFSPSLISFLFSPLLLSFFLYYMYFSCYHPKNITIVQYMYFLLTCIFFFQQESGSAIKELEKKFDEVSKVIVQSVPVALTTWQITKTVVQKCILACQIFENHSFCNMYGCRWLLQGAKKTNFQVCPSTSLDFIFSSFPKTYLLQYFWNLNFPKRISMKLCIYWAEWTSLLARLSDTTFFTCCCLWTGLKHFSKWSLLFQLTQCAFFFKFLGRLMSRQILIWNMWRIPSLRRRKRRKHFWKVWMMWVTIIIISLTQQSAATFLQKVELIWYMYCCGL